MTNVSNTLVREAGNPKTLLNTDQRGLEEYKFKKKILSDINKLKEFAQTVDEENTSLRLRVSQLEEKLEILMEALEKSKGKE